jgi:hypothetical protein
MKKLLIFLPIGMLVLYGCGGNSGNAELRANAMCDCVKEVVDITSINAANIEDKMQELNRDKVKQTKYAKCLLGVLEGMNKDIADLNQEDKKTYTKNLLKAGIDCDCADKLMDNIPYDMIKLALPSLKEEVARMESKQ